MGLNSTESESVGWFGTLESVFLTRDSGVMVSYPVKRNSAPWIKSLIPNICFVINSG